MNATHRRIVAWTAAVVMSLATVAASTPDLRLVEAVRSGDAAAVDTLLKADADVNAADADGSTPLAWAVYREDAAAVEALLSKGADPNTANDYGITPLWLACSNRNDALVSRLLEAGANPNAALASGEMVLMMCSRMGAVDGVRALLARGADVNAREPRRGHTALMWAAASRQPDVVRVLIAQGADVHARTHAPQGFSPMVFATWSADVPAVSTGGFTPLLFAAQRGDVVSAGLLLDAGANVNVRGPDALTPLLMASASGHEPLALYLLDRGADPNATDESGLTALHYALREGMKVIHGLAEDDTVQQVHAKDPKVAAAIAQAALTSSTRKPPSAILIGSNMKELTKALLARGADPNAQIRQFPPHLRLQSRPQVSLLGATPFLLAAAIGDADTMRLLVQHGAKPTLGSRADEKQLSEDGFSDDAQIQANATPLQIAAGMGRSKEFTDAEERAALEAVKLAVALGNDVNAYTTTGWTALHAAAFTAADSIVEFLVQKGAKVNVQNGCGQTPLSLAEGEDPKGLLERTKLKESTVALLKKLGAGSTKPGGPLGKCVLGRYGI